jgi:hypothetical protein
MWDVYGGVRGELSRWIMSSVLCFYQCNKLHEFYDNRTYDKTDTDRFGENAAWDKPSQNRPGRFDPGGGL